jgi:hypothetical protein
MAFNVSNAQARESLSNYDSIDAEVLPVGHGEPWTGGELVKRRRERAGV